MKRLIKAILFIIVLTTATLYLVKSKEKVAEQTENELVIQASQENSTLNEQILDLQDKLLELQQTVQKQEEQIINLNKTIDEIKTSTPEQQKLNLDIIRLVNKIFTKAHFHEDFGNEIKQIKILAANNNYLLELIDSLYQFNDLNHDSNILETFNQEKQDINKTTHDTKILGSFIKIKKISKGINYSNMQNDINIIYAKLAHRDFLGALNDIQRLDLDNTFVKTVEELHKHIDFDILIDKIIAILS